MATLSNFLLSGGNATLQDDRVTEWLNRQRELNRPLPFGMDEAQLREYVRRALERGGAVPPSRDDPLLDEMLGERRSRDPYNTNYFSRRVGSANPPPTSPSSRLVRTTDPNFDPNNITPDAAGDRNIVEVLPWNQPGPMEREPSPPPAPPPPPQPPPMSNTPPPEPNTWTSSINPPRLPPEREEQIIADANNQVATRDDLRRQSAHLANLFGNAMPDQDPRPNAMSMGLLQGLGPPQVAPASSWLSNPLDQRRPRSMARYGSNSLFGRMA